MAMGDAVWAWLAGYFLLGGVPQCLSQEYVRDKKIREKGERELGAHSLLELRILLRPV